MKLFIGLLLLFIELAFITYQLGYGGGKRSEGKTQIGGNAW